MNNATEHQRPLVLLGVGNPLRGDDAIGHLLAEALQDIRGARFFSYAVGTAVENATHIVRQAAGGVLLIADAVFDENLPEGSWSIYPAESLDSICHTTHTLPLSMLISLWHQEMTGLEVRFLGISIRSNTEFAPLSVPLQRTLEELKLLFSTHIQE